MKLTFFIILVTVPFAALDAPAQNITSAPHLPTPVEFQSTDMPAQPVTRPFICGANSKIDVRPTVRENLAGPISVFSLDGKSLTIRPADGTGFPSVYTLPFNADTKGNFYAAIQPTNGVQWYLAAYDNQGHFKWRSPFAVRFTPTFLLPINNDQFIVGGVGGRSSPENPNGGSVVGVFGKDGVMLHSLSLPDDWIDDGDGDESEEERRDLPVVIEGRAEYEQARSVDSVRGSDRRIDGGGIANGILVGAGRCERDAGVGGLRRCGRIAATVPAKSGDD
jgi:hypothetical protein